jgi:hypothetical protein
VIKEHSEIRVRATPSDAVQTCLAHHGLQAVRMDEIAAGRSMALSMIGPGIASEAAFMAIHRRNGAAVFVYRQDDEAQGFLGLILLRQSGLRRLEADQFDAVAPDLSDVCTAKEAPAAIYGWGFAARTVRASGACVMGLMALADQVFPDLPFFCRAATPRGERVILGKMGYSPLIGSASGLLVRRPEPASAA